MGDRGGRVISVSTLVLPFAHNNKAHLNKVGEGRTTKGVTVILDVLSSRTGNIKLTSYSSAGVDRWTSAGNSLCRRASKPSQTRLHDGTKQDRERTFGGRVQLFLMAIVGKDGRLG